MNQRRFRPDTVDRIRPCADIRIDGKVRFVIAVALAPTAARPARIALTVGDPADSMAQVGEVIYLDAGEIVDQTWDPRIDRPTRDDLAQPASLDDPHYESEMTLRAMRAIHLVVGPLSGVGIRAGGWIACDPNDARPSVPLTQRTRDQEKATCPDCLSASGDDNADSD